MTLTNQFSSVQTALQEMKELTFNNNQSSDIIKEAKGAFLKDLNPIPIDPTIDPEFGSCFNCWQFGHLYQKCPQPKLHEFCYNCGRLSKRLDTCPRCCQAYEKYKRGKTQSLIQDSSEDVADKKQTEHGKDEFQNCETSACQTSNSETEDEYFSCEEEDNYDDFVVDEDLKPSDFVTGDLLVDFVKLNNMIKHLPIQTQTAIILLFVEERCKCKEGKIEKLSEVYIRKVKNYFMGMINFVKVQVQILLNSLFG